MLFRSNIEAYYAGETLDVFTAKAEELKTYPFTLPKVDEGEVNPRYNIFKMTPRRTKCEYDSQCTDMPNDWKYKIV